MFVQYIGYCRVLHNLGPLYSRYLSTSHIHLYITSVEIFWVCIHLSYENMCSKFYFFETTQLIFINKYKIPCVLPIKDMSI